MGWRILFLNPFLQLKEGFEFASTPNATITEFTIRVLAKFFLFIVTPIVEVCNCSMFCCTLLYVHSSIAIILMGKRELITLLNCLPVVS